MPTAFLVVIWDQSQRLSEGRPLTWARLGRVPRQPRPTHTQSPFFQLPKHPTLVPLRPSVFVDNPHEEPRNAVLTR